MTTTTTEALAQRITDYLSGGGLFNPEQANHDAVRDLLIQCRAALEAKPQDAQIDPAGWQLVPTEASDAMTAAAWAEISDKNHGETWEATIEAAYRSMLAAAPKR